MDSEMDLKSSNSRNGKNCSSLQPGIKSPIEALELALVSELELMFQMTFEHVLELVLELPTLEHVLEHMLEEPVLDTCSRSSRPDCRSWLP
jgi:hypothetical protein